jgi:hypothetical protein
MTITDESLTPDMRNLYSNVLHILHSGFLCQISGFYDGKDLDCGLLGWGTVIFWAVQNLMLPS